MIKFGIAVLTVIILVSVRAAIGFHNDNIEANRLFEDLLSDYNKLVRPVRNNSETLEVYFKLKLSQLLDVHEKNQIMTTNVWLKHSCVTMTQSLEKLIDVQYSKVSSSKHCSDMWIDQKLTWRPEDYGGVDVLYVPADMIWLPDIVLYNNADGNYQVSIMTKAKLSYNGSVEWTPPAIYKSMCQINIEWFPFDEQTCEMKFGSWTYGGKEVNLLQNEPMEVLVHDYISGPNVVPEKISTADLGIDLTDFYPSVEWDILTIPSVRHEKTYQCCPAPFIDITYYLTLRRKTLFHTVNLIFPCVGISFLTALVFYLPSDSGEKISLCISILISLTLFFLLLVDIIPSTSLVIPLIGKYLLFTMVLVTLSVVVTVVTLNIHFRSPNTHDMPAWVQQLFLNVLPKYLCIQRPNRPAELFTKEYEKWTSGQQQQFSPTTITPLLTPGSVATTDIDTGMHSFSSSGQWPSFKKRSIPRKSFLLTSGSGSRSLRDSLQRRDMTPMKTAVESVCFIAEHYRKAEEDEQIIGDWKYVALVLDRLFLWVFTLACGIGTAAVIFAAPSILYWKPSII